LLKEEKKNLSETAIFPVSVCNQVKASSFFNGMIDYQCISYKNYFLELLQLKGWSHNFLKKKKSHGAVQNS